MRVSDRYLIFSKMFIVSNQGVKVFLNIYKKKEDTDVLLLYS